MTIAGFVCQFDTVPRKTRIDGLKIVRDFGLGLTRNGEVEVSVNVTN